MKVFIIRASVSCITHVTINNKQKVNISATIYFEIGAAG